MGRPTGALPPYGANWQIGKTVASITFVRKAEAYLQICENPAAREALQLEIDQIKLGEVVLREHRSVENFLQSL